MNQKSKHILYILDHFSPYLGGAEKVFEELIQGMIAQGNKVTIITTRHNKTLPHKHTDGSLTIYRSGRSRYSLLFRGVVLGVLHGKKADIIHTTTYGGALPAWIVSKWLEKPIIITVHELFGKLRKKAKPLTRPLFYVYEKIIISITYSQIICVSDYTRDCLIKWYNVESKNIIRIYNGVDKTTCNNNNGIPLLSGVIDNSLFQDTFTCLYFGHCGYSKGCDLLINALPVLSMTYPDLHMIFNLLDCKERNSTSQAIQKSSVPHTLLYGLTKKQLQALIVSVDCIIIPSRSEGFGLAAAEVSIIKKPLIVSKGGALPEIVSGNVVYLDGEDPLNFLEALINIRTKSYSPLPDKLFSWNIMIEEYKNIYELF